MCWRAGAAPGSPSLTEKRPQEQALRRADAAPRSHGETSASRADNGNLGTDITGSARFDGYDSAVTRVIVVADGDVALARRAYVAAREVGGAEVVVS